MKKTFLLTALAVALLPSCGQNANKKEERQEIPEKKIMVVQTSHNQIPLVYPAQLRGKQDISIYPQVDGILVHLYVSEGENVRQGQKLFAIDPTPYQAAVDNADAVVQMAQANVQTQELEAEATRQLFEKGIVSEHQYKVQNNTLMIAKAKLAEAQAALKSARINLNHTTIYSPHNGVVGNIRYRQGSLVGTSIIDPLTIVSDNSTIYAYVSINSTDYMELMRQEGSKEKLIENFPEAELILGNDSVYEEKGRVETFSGIIDEQTGSISVRIAFANSNGILAAGGSGNVMFRWDYDGIVIPRDATIELQDKHFVYKCEKQPDGSFKAVSTEISVYRLNENDYIVEDGLQDGDSIVLDGVSKMVNGMAIKPVK